MKSLFIVISAICIFFMVGFSSKRTANFIPTHVQNLEYVEGRDVEEEEPEINDKTAKEDWKRATQERVDDCNTHQIWAVNDPDSFHVIAYKNEHIPKRALFNRSRFVVKEDRKTGEVLGNGLVDLTSYDTGDELINRRIQRYILGVEDSKYSSIGKFTFHIPDWKKDQKEWDTTINVQLDMLGKQFSFPVFVTIHRNIQYLQIYSKNDARFTYSYPGLINHLQTLMKRCNHHSIATFVDVGLDAKLAGVCK